MDYLVKKHNNLIEARYSLTIPEQRFLLILISKIRKDDEDFKEHEILIKNFLEEFDLKTHNLYERVSKVALDMQKQVWRSERPSGKEGFIQFNWYHHIEYKHDEGKISVQLHEMMKPYLLELKEHFTKYDLRNIVHMRSSYQIRLFELLKMNQYKGMFEITVEKLREIFEIPESYDFYEIKRSIIEPTKKFCKENCDITFKYQIIKQARRVHALIFTVIAQEKSFTTAQQLNLPIQEQEEKANQEKIEKTNTNITEIEQKLRNFISENFKKEECRGWLDYMRVLKKDEKIIFAGIPNPIYLYDIKKNFRKKFVEFVSNEYPTEDLKLEFLIGF